MRLTALHPLVPMVLLATLLAGCSVGDQPYVSSRTTLGTTVSITAYADPETAETAVDTAFGKMDAVSGQLDAYTSSTPVASFNVNPYQGGPLPDDAQTVLDAIDRLGVGDAFSVSLLGVSELYGFEDTEVVPRAEALRDAVAVSESFACEAGTARFDWTAPEGLPSPGLDFGGAAKGLGLDEATQALAADGVENAIISAGSTTVTSGSKPDGDAWRIGIEDPRDTGRIVAVVEADGPCAVSTSGDYQRYFEVGGVRYHHILDPQTGEPARGLRSLTVFAPYEAMSGLDADILSTALFVMGPDAAEEYALAHGLGLYMVDDEGRALTVPAPEESGVRLVIEAEPLP